LSEHFFGGGGGDLSVVFLAGDIFFPVAFYPGFMPLYRGKRLASTIKEKNVFEYIDKAE